jgi:ABC-2 type transport system permease protein
MNALSYAVVDATTMLRRNLKHMLRYPTVVMFVVAIPVVLMLLFVYVFGGTLGAGLDAVAGGRHEYANYLVPGILVLTLAGGGQGTAISVAMDMTDGIIARFKTMNISRASVLWGHVLGTMVQTGLGLAAVLGVALAVGFRPDANPVEWVAAIAVLAMITLAFAWLSAALGLAAKNVESASNLPMFLFLLPFLGSGFAPTDSMPGAVRWFAEHQPFTPFTETLRGLLLGTEIGGDAIATIGWSAAIALLSYLWAMSLYNRDPSLR